MDMVEAPFDHCAFSDNRDRMLKYDITAKFFRAVTRQAGAAGLMSDEHFSVDGTLIEAWASMKSFRPKDDKDDDGDSNRWSDFRGKKRKNETHASRTDPESRLMRKGLGKEAKLCFGAHALMENRNGLLKDIRITLATGRCEREAAVEMLDSNGIKNATLGADAGYCTQDFIDACEERAIEPHLADSHNYCLSELYGEKYAASQKVRKRIEQVFGWVKTCAGLRKTRFKGRARTSLFAYAAGAAFNLVRMAKLMPATT